MIKYKLPALLAYPIVYISGAKSMVREGTGSIFKRADGKFFVYLPQAVAEDTSFPFSVNSSTKVKVRFTDDGKVMIERVDE